MFSLICAWINGWVNNHEVGDLRHHRLHYDFIVILWFNTGWFSHIPQGTHIPSKALRQSYDCPSARKQPSRIWVKRSHESAEKKQNKTTTNNHNTIKLIKTGCIFYEKHCVWYITTISYQSFFSSGQIEIYFNPGVFSRLSKSASICHPPITKWSWTSEVQLTIAHGADNRVKHQISNSKNSALILTHFGHHYINI